MKKPFSGIISSQNGMRQAQKEKKNKNQSRIPFILGPGKKIPKKIEKKNQKIKKPLFGIVFSKYGMIQAEKYRKKKILVPNFVHTRPGQENSEKNSKKI